MRLVETIYMIQVVSVGFERRRNIFLNFYLCKVFFLYSECLYNWGPLDPAIVL